MSYLDALSKSSVLDFDKLQKTIEEQNNPQKSNKEKFKDDRFWKPERDKSGNGFAVVRFLPPALGADGSPEDAVWVKLWDHAFQGPTGKWYIEKSLSTLDQKDPLGELNSFLWNSTKDDNHPNRKQARNQKRRLKYVSNVLVVKDPAHPENEGKVFLFSYGKKIKDKIDNAMFPKIPSLPQLKVFDPFQGANFNIIIETVTNFPNYDQSRFDGPSPIAATTDEIEAVCKQAHSLLELKSPVHYKSRDELQKRLDEVMGFDTQAFIKAGGSTSPGAAPAASYEPAKVKTAEDRTPSPDDEDDDDLAEYQALARQSAA